VVARHSEHDAAARVDSDRIGKMAARRRPSVAGQIARRLKGFNGRSCPLSNKPAWAGGSRRQRVIVKALVSRHGPSKARGSITRHAAYLGRDSASGDGRSGVFYDASRDAVDARSEVIGWAADRHHFRVIISPEQGQDIPDMTAYVRQVMARIGSDLGTKLDWFGINHHNTDNPHAHVMIRGRREDGTDLVIPRQYLSHGMRERACEVATELLGERSVEQVQEAKLKEVQAERFTSLDRMIERCLEGGRIDVSPTRSIGFGPEDRGLVTARLQHLQTLGLAQKQKGTWWALEADFKQTLRDLGSRNDVIKQLYATLGTEAGRVHRMAAGNELPQPIAGIVIALGNADELSDDRFVVLRDARGQAHYGRVPESDEYRAIRVGSIAELGAGVHRRQEVNQQIVEVAKAHGGVYSTEPHAAHLHTIHPDWTDRQIDSRVRSASARLAFVAGYEGSGVQAMGDGRYEITGPEFDSFSRRRSARTDLRVVASYSLPEQVQARAVTWLDCQAFLQNPDERLTEHPAVQEALDQRRQWLVKHGYAERADADGSCVQLVPGAIKRLAAEERQAADRKLEERYHRPVSELVQGGSVTGKYQGIEELHSGRRIVVLTDDDVVVAPTRRSPQANVGDRVTVQRTTDRGVTVDRSQEQSLPNQSRYLDGLERGR
jgi:type IV secretory pathway VirD2 relaxase